MEGSQGVSCLQLGMKTKGLSQGLHRKKGGVEEGFEGRANPSKEMPALYAVQV